MSFRLILASASLFALTACQAPAPAGSPEPTEAAAPQPLLTASQIEAGLPRPDLRPARPPSGDAAPAAYAPDAGMVRLQILLDRSRFSPGVIDGLGGENTRQAIAAWRKANDLGETGDADAALLQALAAADTARSWRAIP